MQKLFALSVVLAILLFYKQVLFSIKRISVDDFIRNFTKLEICMLSPHNCGDVDGQQWEILVYEGEWQAYVTAGGCRNYPDTFHTNPQFRYASYY